MRRQVFKECFFSRNGNGAGRGDQNDPPSAAACCFQLPNGTAGFRNRKGVYDWLYPPKNTKWWRIRFRCLSIGPVHSAAEKNPGISANSEMPGSAEGVIEEPYLEKDTCSGFDH